MVRAFAQISNSARCAVWPSDTELISCHYTCSYLSAPAGLIEILLHVAAIRNLVGIVPLESSVQISHFVQRSRLLQAFSVRYVSHFQDFRYYVLQ